jgi:signal transduction histidine kinase
LQEVELVGELLEPLHALYELPIDTSTGNGPVTVRTFPDDLKVALHEVVQNSVDTGATSIQVDAQKTASGAVIHVVDNGRGFSPEAEVRKFEAGFSTRKDETPKHQGLGLYIARRMVESAGGSIRVENEGAGARVTLTIADLSRGGLESV